MYQQNYYGGIQLMHQPINPAQAPLPNVPCSPGIQQLLPAMVTNLVTIVQNTAQATPLRAAYYNKVAEAGYQNGFFADLVRGAMDVLEQKLIVLTGRLSALEIVQGVADAFVNYRVARQIHDDPALANTLPPQLAQAAQGVVMEFQRDMEETQMAAMRMQGIQPQQTGYNYGNPTAGFQPNYQRQSNSSHPAFGQMSAGDQYPSAEQPRRNWQPSWKSDAPVARLPATPREPEPAPTQQVVRELQHASLDNKALNRTGKFARSEQKPYDHAYDHNQFRLTYSTQNGYAQPTLNRSQQLDKTAHLGRPLFTKQWTPDVTAQQFQERLLEAKKADAEKPVEATVAEANVLTTNLEDAFIQAKSTVKALAKQTKQIHVAVHKAALMEPRLSTMDFKPVLNALIVSQSPAEAIQILKEASKAADPIVENIEFVERIKQDLTDRVNHFVKVECGLPDCTITDYTTDASDLIECLQDAYGLGTLYQEQHSRFMSETLTYVTPEQVGDTVINGDLPKELTEDQHCVYLLKEIACAVVDQTSIELSVTIPEGNGTVLLVEAAAPNAYNIVRSLSDKHVLESAQRTYLRTVDGVTFEVMQSKLVNNTHLIRLVA